MKVLVLGGTGAMGEPLVRILASQGHEVCVTTRNQKLKSEGNVRYIVGNAHDITFISTVLKDHYDSIVDFMSYRSDEFASRCDLFLSSCSHYLFLSSSRVYADTGASPITESSPRLLDAVNDERYLKSDEYALAKAREENVLRENSRKNWTIIRPYITYNDKRLQLGVFEKELWLQHVLDGHSIVFFRDVAEKMTTLTHGDDVARHMASLIGNRDAMGEAVHITGKPIRWSDVLDVYLDVLERHLGKRPDVVWLDSSTEFGIKAGNIYQLRYDRLLNRTFDNTKIVSLTKDPDFIGAREGLASCLEAFLKEGCPFRSRDWHAEGYFDRWSHEHTRLSSLPSHKARFSYLCGRYLPHIVWRVANKLSRMLH